MLRQKKIVFRCKGGRETGWGHVMRCVYLAQWLQGKYKVFFVINQDAEIREFLKKRGYTTFEVSVRGTEGKFHEIVVNTILGLEPHMVINDIHDTSPEYMQALKNHHIKMVNFDDMSNSAKMAQVVVDANRKEKEGKCFGPLWIVLSSVYGKLSKKKRAIRKNVKNILLSFGGSDPENVTEKTLRALDKKIPQDINLYVVIGPAFVHTKTIEKWKQHEQVIFIHEIDDLSPYLTRIDLALVGGGLTMYESLSLGTPTIVIAQNKQQAKNARRMERRGAVINIGEARKVSDKKITRKVLGCIGSIKEREKLSARAKTTIDGQGIFRVLEQIELCV